MTWMDDQLRADLQNGFIDGSLPAGALGPEILTNRQGNTIFNEIKNELRTCTNFKMAVAFITPAVLVPIKSIMMDLAQKGVGGELLTGTYLQFNSPQVFAELMKIPNLKVRLTGEVGFHQKGYWFDHQDYETLIIGSANLTMDALLKNAEWCLKVSSKHQGAVIQQFAAEFGNQWQAGVQLNAAWLTAYQKGWQAPVLSTASQTSQSDLITPNAMQKAACKRIEALRQAGEKRALVISATGTGKTYLAAFAVQSAQPNRVLVVAHREQLLLKARASFQKIIGGQDQDYGFFTSQQTPGTARYVFATVQTLARHLDQIGPADFDYVIIDEVHHAGAVSYQKIINWLQPRFLLGLTATPDRTDDFNVYALFNYQLAYEIRLQEALSERMLCPFQFVGVSDYVWQGQTVSEKTPLKHLIQPERVDWIIKVADYYGHDGDVLHGLIFCSRTKEAQELAALLTQKGYPAQALTGQDSAAKREQAVARLQAGELVYLITVDVFNEGIDIPCVNQVIMLRDTQSAIVFLQQLGRGLRKAIGKQFLTVIDFIGNYQHNYLIPQALTDDHSHQRSRALQTLRAEPTLGISTISFTRLAYERILASVEKAQLTGMSLLKSEFSQLKQRLGRTPLMADFQRAGILDESIFAEKFKTYPRFLQKMGATVNLNPQTEPVLQFLTEELANGKRQHELILLAMLTKQSTITVADYQAQLHQNGCWVDDATLASVKRVLTLEYYLTKGKIGSRIRYGNQPLIITTGQQIQLHPQIQNYLRDAEFRLFWNDAIETGRLQAKKYDQKQPLTLNQRYTRMDAVKLLNNAQYMVPNGIGGYYFMGETGILFVTYHHSNTRAAIDFDNQFRSRTQLSFYSKTNRTLNSRDAEKLLNPNASLHLFVKNSDEQDQSQFAYLGLCQVMPGSAHEFLQKGTNKPIFGVELLLKHPVDQALYLAWQNEGAAHQFHQENS